MKEGQSTSRPPLLEESNYGYWKARMKAFLRAIDEKTWRAVVVQWSPPITIDEQGVTRIKPEEQWTAEEGAAATGNSKALNAIFAAVDANNFRLISNCDLAKQAWEILQTAHEGTDRVKLSRLQIIATQFENLRMLDEETVTEFNAKLCDLANEAHALGEPIPEEKLIRKVLRSLPTKFDMKVTAIEEAQNVRFMRLEELMGSLKQFEMKLVKEDTTSKDKNVGLKAEAEIKQTVPDDQMSMLVKNLGKLLKNVESRTERSSSSRRQFRRGSERKRKGKEPVQDEDDKKEMKKGVQCWNCEGYGHIEADCPSKPLKNSEKKNNKSMTAKWSDSDESDEENCVVLTSVSDVNLREPKKVEIHYGIEVSESEDEEDSSDSLADLLRKVLKQCEAVLQTNQAVTDRVNRLEEERRKGLLPFNNQVTILKRENSGRQISAGSSPATAKSADPQSNILDEILSYQRLGKGKTGLGYTGEESSRGTVFIKASAVETDEKKNSDDFSKSADKVGTRHVNKRMLQHRGQHSSQTKQKTQNKRSSETSAENQKINSTLKQQHRTCSAEKGRAKSRISSCCIKTPVHVASRKGLCLKESQRRIAKTVAQGYWITKNKSKSQVLQIWKPKHDTQRAWRLEDQKKKSSGVSQVWVKKAPPELLKDPPCKAAI